MREAVFEAAILLPLIFIAWMAFIFIALFSFESNVLGKMLAFYLAVFSVPGYFYLDAWQSERASEMREKERTLTAYKSSETYKKLCAETPPIIVKRVVESSHPVDIRMTKGKDAYMDLMRPEDPHKTVCWLDGESSRCKTSNIGFVESAFHGSSDTCTQWPEQYDCTKFYRDERDGKGDKRVKGLSAQYLMSISERERPDPLISKYQVTIKDLSTNELIAETYFYRKGWFGNVKRTEAEKHEPQYCPPRDVFVAEFLGNVFPIPK